MNKFQLMRIDKKIIIKFNIFNKSYKIYILKKNSTVQIIN